MTSPQSCPVLAACLIAGLIGRRPRFTLLRLGLAHVYEPCSGPGGNIRAPRSLARYLRSIFSSRGPRSSMSPGEANSPADRADRSRALLLFVPGALLRSKDASTQDSPGTGPRGDHP